jgi:hypothetical protein
MHTPGRRRAIGRRGPIAALALVALAVAACSGTAASPAAGGITITDPWARTSPMVSGAGAAYMVIANGGSAADALTGGSSDVAEAVEVHETVVMGSAAPMESTGMGGMESPAMGGMMGMQRIDSLEIPAGGSVELKPGGYHIMLIGLTRELKAGDSIEVTLTFEKAGDVKVTMPVKEQ